MSTRRPQDLVFTLFGDYLQHRPGPVWVGSIIALLEPLGLSDGSSRTVLSRMSRKGWFSTVRDGRNSFYELTARGRHLLEEGEARIYHPPREEAWDGSWFLLSYSIPEERRHLRDQLRTRLSWLGFGSLGNGLWLSPHDVRPAVEALAAELEVTDLLELFRADHLGFTDEAELVSRSWDLPAVQGRYVEFVDRHLPAFLECREALGSGGLPGEMCYVRRFDLIHEYREFPLLDPYLPRGLEPEGWAGECASALFEKYHDLLEESANGYVDSVLEAAPASPASVKS